MKRPFAFIGFTFALTLLALCVIPIKAVTPAMLVLLALSVMSLSIKGLRQAKVIPIVLWSMFFACFLLLIVNYNSVLPSKELAGTSAKTTFRIVDLPDYNRETSKYSYVIRTTKIDSENAPDSIKVKLYSDTEIAGDYYDEISASLDFFAAGSSPFDSYGNYSKGIYICAAVREASSVKTTKKPPNYYILKLREKISDAFRENLDKKSAAMSLALITGDKSLMSDKAVGEIRNCGLSHYFAVSGFHISVVCMGINFILSILGVKKRLNSALTIFVMLVYCGVTGFSVSCVRACIMTAVMLISKCFDYKSDTLNALGFATLIICLNPFAVTDPSAVMTVCAVLGICVIYNEAVIRMKIKKRILLSAVKAFLLPLCVSLALLPSVYLFFGKISLVSVLVNAFVEIPVTLLVFLSVAFCFAFKISFVSTAVGFFISAVSDLLYGVFSFLSDNLGFLSFDISSEIFGLAIGAVLLFTGFCLIVKKSVSVKALFVFTAAVIAVSALAVAYEKYGTNKIIVSEYGSVMVYDGKNAVMVGVKNDYDFTLADSITKGRSSVFIDCGKYLRLRNSYGEGYDLYKDAEISAGENISAEIFQGEVLLTVGGKEIIIDDGSVVLENKSFTRLASKKYDNAFSVRLIFGKNSQVIARREGLWQS